MELSFVNGRINAKFTISNMHTLVMTETSNNRGIGRSKPNIVKDYNIGMSGIDKADQMISYYDSLRKTICWYKKVGVHIFNIIMHNAYALLLIVQKIMSLFLSIKNM